MPDIRSRLEQHIPRLRRYALSLTKDQADADDLVQEALMKAIGKQHLWQEGSDLRAWLFTILHNAYINEKRRQSRQGPNDNIEDVPIRVREKATDYLQLRDLNRALSALTSEQLATINLVGIEGVKYEEAAEALCIPIGTVRSRLCRARDDLRKAFQWQYDMSSD